MALMFDFSKPTEVKNVVHDVHDYACMHNYDITLMPRNIGECLAGPHSVPSTP